MEIHIKQRPSTDWVPLNKGQWQPAGGSQGVLSMVVDEPVELSEQSRVD